MGCIAYYFHNKHSVDYYETATWERVECGILIIFIVIFQSGISNKDKLPCANFEFVSQP